VWQGFFSCRNHTAFFSMCLMCFVLCRCSLVCTAIVPGLWHPFFLLACGWISLVSHTLHSVSAWHARKALSVAHEQQTQPVTTHPSEQHTSPGRTLAQTASRNPAHCPCADQHHDLTRHVSWCASHTASETKLAPTGKHSCLAQDACPSPSSSQPAWHAGLPASNHGRQHLPT
jgi:hypothetical protein